jgi:hypothetical protein
LFPAKKGDNAQTGGEEMKSIATDQTQKWKIKTSARSSCDCDGSVLLDTEKGVFYGANTLGSQIWESIRRSPDGVTVESLCDQIASNVEVPREQFARDVQEYLQELETRGLLEKEKPR